MRGVTAIRRATPADLDAIVAIERLSFSDAWSRASFAELLDRPEVYFVAAIDDGAAAGAPALVGYAVALFIVGEGEVANVAVHPHARGRGIGARLLDDVLREGRERGVAAVFLEVRESNAAARGLYVSRGFRQVGRRRGYYRRPQEDALVLRWDGGSPA